VYIGEGVVFTAKDSGEDMHVEALNRHCPAKNKIILKIGAQVILVKTTEAQHGLVNGARGIIVRFTAYVSTCMTILTS
jgi:ATP-dependent DNA helicase PIF1